MAFCVSTSRTRAAAARRLLDHLVRLVAGLGQDLLAVGLGLGELRLDFLRVGEALGDFFAARFEHGENRLVGKPPQDEKDDGKTDRLREQDLPLDS